MRILLKSIFFCLIFLFFSYAHAEVVQIDDATQEVCNQVIQNIYQDILKAKEKYPELTGFDQQVLVKNQHGIDSITYRYNDPRDQAPEPYEFRVTIVGMDDKPYEYPGFESRHYGFPVLDLRTSSFIHRNYRIHHFNLEKIINKQSELLYEHQQKYLPLQVILKPQKDTFKVGERIEFEVILKNQTHKSFKVKGLAEESLFFTIDNKEWGTHPTSSSQNDIKEVVIPPDGFVSRGFKGDSFDSPRDVEIFCTYNIAHKGIVPFGSLKIKIVN